MSVASLCELCQSERVIDGCERCGRLVCADHYDRETGLCTDCLAEVGWQRPGSKNENRNRPDGVDEYRF